MMPPRLARKTRLTQRIHFLASSPTTALIEAWALGALAWKTAFAPKDRVFSYLWPKESSASRTFAFYRDGYRERNAGIRTALTANATQFVGVFDIKNFYGSIPKDSARSVFDARLGEAGLDRDDERAVRATSHRYLSSTTGERGIALGPPLSHLFGHLVLERVDEDMTARFGGRYFRYVDDVVVLGSRQECAEAEGLLAKRLGELGLTIHPGKRDLLSGMEWLRHAPDVREPAWEGSFEGLLIRISLYLARPLSDLHALQAALRSEGVTLPLKRLQAQSRLGRFLLYWGGRGARRRRWTVRALGETAKSLQDAARNVKRVLLAELQAAVVESATDSPTRGKWRLQRVRYAVNRLIYLCPSKDYESLRRALRGVDGVHDTRTVLMALETHDATPLLRLPGAAVTTFCAVIQEGGQPSAIRLEGVDMNGPAADALVVLALYGRAEVPPERLGACSPELRRLLQFATGTSARVREHPDFSFLDELESLSLHGLGEMNELLTSRFDDREETGLEALRLGLDGSS